MKKKKTIEKKSLFFGKIEKNKSMLIEFTDSFKEIIKNISSK